MSEPARRASEPGWTRTVTLHAGSDSPPSSARSIRALILLAVLINSAYAGSKVALPLFAIQLGASTFTVGIMMASYTFIAALLALRMGRMLDRIGPRRPMIIGAGGVIAGLCSAFAFGNLAALFVCAVLVGSFGGLFFMAHTQAIGKASTRHNRTAVLSMSAMGYSASSFLGPMAAGALIDGVGHGQALLLLGVAPVAAMLGLQFRLLPLSDHAQRSTDASGHSRVLDFFRNPATRGVYVTGIISNSAWECMNLMAPIYGHSIGLSATTIGVVLGAFSVGTFAVRIMMPFLAHRLPPWRLLGFAFLVAACGFALIPFTATAPLLIALTFTIGMGLGISQPLVTSLLFETAPERRIGEALGLRTMLVKVGEAVFPLALGGLGTLLGVAPIYWGVAAIMGAGVFTTQRRHKARNPPR